MRMTRGGTIGDHRHRFGRGVRGKIHDLYIKDRRQSAQSLRADAQSVDLVKNL